MRGYAKLRSVTNFNYAPMIALGLQTRSPAGANARLSILTFHRVYSECDPVFTTEPNAETFGAWLSAWARWFNVLPLTEAVERLRDGRLPARAACITFDDGYVDNLEIAAPILKAQGIPATFFVATDFLDGGMMFNDRVIEAFRQARGDAFNLSAMGLGTWSLTDARARAQGVDGVLRQVKYLPYEEREKATQRIAELASAQLDPHPMMTESQVRALADMGFEIGAHTCSHPILLQVPDNRAANEMRVSRARLQAISGQAVRMFAYPNGKPNEDYGFRHTLMVRDAGFLGAVATIPGAAQRSADLFQIPRFTPWHGASWKSAAQFWRNYGTPVRALVG
jgi:peptidoglycan/xylan/chitin deacetylase (PgdA/CDA1 family)